MMSYLLIGAILLLLVNLFVYFVIENHYVTTRIDNLQLLGKEMSRKLDNRKLSDDTYFNNVIKTSSKGMDARIYVLDTHGIVQYDSEHRSVMSNLSELAVFKDSMHGISSIEKSVNEKSKVLYYAEPFYFEKRIKGTVVFTVSLVDVYKNVKTVQQEMIVISVVIMFFIIVFSNTVSDRITGPIETVIGAIKSMAEGKLEQKVEVSGNDEIARLCYAFNNMNEKVNLMDQQRRLFVADASHELKSPLASIKVLVQSLQSGGINNKEIASEFLQDIDNEVNRLSGIVNNLLELTKIEGSYGFKIEGFEVSSLCREVIAKLMPISEKRNVKVTLKARNVIITGNKENIFRAVYNIVENAIKYSEDGSSVNVAINMDDKYVKIYVKDSGPGIPIEDKAKIFERFYRVDKTRARKTGGSGLGLSIAMEIIKRHNGKIDVATEIGKGSTFVISLPFEFEA